MPGAAKGSAQGFAVIAIALLVAVGIAMFAVAG